MDRLFRSLAKVYWQIPMSIATKAVENKTPFYDEKMDQVDTTTSSSTTIAAPSTPSFSLSSLPRKRVIIPNSMTTVRQQKECLPTLSSDALDCSTGWVELVQLISFVSDVVFLPCSQRLHVSTFASLCYV